MASELRVNTSTNRVGLGTITYTDTGPIISGITTGNNFKTGTTNVHSTGVELVNINTAGATATFGGDLSIPDTIVHTGDTNTKIRFPAADTITAETGGSERLRIHSGGQVTVGTPTSNTSDRFTIVDPGNAFMSLRSDAEADGNSQVIDFAVGTGNRSSSNLVSTITASIPTGAAASGTLKGYLAFSTNSGDSLSERLRIDTGGDCLFLGGTLRIKNSANNAQYGAIYGDSTSFHLNAGGNLKLYSGGGERIRLSNDGQVSIQGTTTAFDTTGDLNSLQLYYETDSGQASIGPYSSGGSTHLSFYTNAGGSAATEKLRIDSSGRIGLGIANPDAYFSSYNRVVMGRTNDTGGMTIVSATSSGGYISFADGTSGNAAYRGMIAYQHNGDYMTFGTDGGVERIRIDSNGRFIFRGDSTGGTSGLGGFGTHTWTPKVQVLHDQGQVIIRDGDEVWGGALHLAKCRGTYASPTAAAQNDRAGGLYYHAHDGTDFLNYVAGIESYLDNGVGSNDTPGRLVFSTANDGENSLTERMRITSTGRIGMSQSSPDAATLHIGNSVATTGSNIALQVGTITGQNRYLTIHHFGNQQNFHSLKMRVNDNGLIAMLDMGNPYGSQNHGTKIKFSGYQENECASIEVVNTANNNANSAEMRFKTGGTTEGMRINKNGVVMINTQTDTDISDVHKHKVGGVFRHKTRNSAEIDHGFYAVSTGSGSFASGYFHMKTDIATNSSAMFLITVKGYAYGQGKVVFCETCGYCYSSNNNIINQQDKSWDGTTSVTTYKSSDGYVVIRFTPGGWSSYYMGFWVDISQQNPAKSGLNHKVTASAIDSSSTYYG